MAQIYNTYDRAALAQAVKAGTCWTFSLKTNDITALGLTNEDDIHQVREGGRFDLKPWRGWNPNRSLMAPVRETPMSILHDASSVAPYLYLQLDQSGGPDGMGDITATYNPPTSDAASPTLRVLEIDVTHE